MALVAIPSSAAIVGPGEIGLKERARLTLDSWSEAFVKERLQAELTPSQLEKLNADDNESAARRFREVLDELVTESATNAERIACVFRLAQLDQVWLTENAVAEQNEDSFKRTSVWYDILNASIIVGAISCETKHGPRRTIQEKWGDDWYSHFPAAIKPTTDERDLEPKLTAAIAKDAERTTDKTTCYKRYEAAVNERCDFGARRSATGARRHAPYTKHLIVSDVEHINGTDALPPPIPRLHLEDDPLPTQHESRKRKKGAGKTAPRKRSPKGARRVVTVRDAIEDAAEDTAAADGNGDAEDTHGIGVVDQNCATPAVVEKLQEIVRGCTQHGDCNHGRFIKESLNETIGLLQRHQCGIRARVRA